MKMPFTQRSLSLTRRALLVLTLGFTFSACDSAEPDDDGPGEEELITRVVLTLSDGTNTVTSTAEDPDGDGTNFQIETLELRSNTDYTGTIQVFDDVNDEDITQEIEEEAAEHQFFYITSGGITDRVTITVTDQDENSLPVGLEFELSVDGADAQSGLLRIILSHFDDQPKDGTTQSDETDIDIVFPVDII